ncbi:hypothetical protein QAD02_023360 [Eretmocerus hayati]|uniref:Uncharacterized protein n=1 Tax=Eretmocerus hayati TaxID=131215 RepID=A0ACC2PXR4_9HYME|nr:hypothetical protein QAD02_023360 [Eretmocerus hayati]
MLPQTEDNNDPDDYLDIVMDEDWIRGWDDIDSDEKNFEVLPQEVADKIMGENNNQLNDSESQQQPASSTDSEQRDVLMRMSVTSDTNEVQEVEFSIAKVESLSVDEFEKLQTSPQLSPIATIPSIATLTCDTPQSLVIGDDDSDDEETPDENGHLAGKPLKKYESLFVYPPPPEKAGIPIHMEDYCCLKRDEFLNDVIIDFYMKYLIHERMSPDDAQVTHIFSSHFFSRLSNPPGCTKNDNPVEKAQKRHAGVSRWTKSINIFEKNFIIIPVNEHAHWYLVIICFPGLVGTDDQTARDKFEGKSTIRGPCILIFDSLSTSKKTRVVQILRTYLHSEYEAKFGENKSFDNEVLKVIYPSAPSQKNATDCGLFILQYVESFFATPTLLPNQSLKKWFRDSVILRKRKEIADLVCSLTIKFNPGRAIEFPQIPFPIVPSEDSSSDEEPQKNVTVRRKRTLLKTPLDIEIIPSSSRSSNGSHSPLVFSPLEGKSHNTGPIKKKRISRIQTPAKSSNSNAMSVWLSSNDDSPPKSNKKLVRNNRRILSSDDDSDVQCSSPKIETVINLDEDSQKYASQTKLSSNVSHRSKSQSQRSVSMSSPRIQKMMDMAGKENEKKNPRQRVYIRKEITRNEIMRPKIGCAADVEPITRMVSQNATKHSKPTDPFYNNMFDIENSNKEKGINPLMGFRKFKKKLLPPPKDDELVEV